MLKRKAPTKKTLHQSLPIVVQAVAGKDVRVHIGDYSPSSNGEDIYIPATEADDEKAAVLTYGFAGHEGCHVRYTQRSQKDGIENMAHHDIYNLLEDIRIERAGGKRMPGLKRRLTQLVELLADDGLFDMAEPGMHPAAVMQKYMSYRLRYDVLGQRALGQHAESAELALKQILSPGTITKLSALMYEVTTLKQTRDSVELSRRILAMIKEQIEDQEKDASNGGQGEAEEGGQGQEGAGESASTGADNGTDSDTNGKNGPSPEGRDGAQQPTMSAQDAGAGGDAAALQKILDDSDQSFGYDIGELTAKELERRAAESNPQKRIIVASEEVLPPLGRDRSGEVDREFKALRVRLHNLVEASALARDETRRSGRRLDTRRLSRVKLGDPRVFLRRQHRTQPNCAVQMLLDRSGSMGGGKLAIAVQCALALGQALESIQGVSVATAAFPGHADGVIPLTRLGETVRATARRYDISAGGGTPMAEAAWYAARELVFRREEKKLLVVVTDGRPNKPQLVSDLVERAGNAGIDCVGVGIQLDQVRNLFPYSIVVSDIAELPQAMFGLMQRYLARLVEPKVT